MPEINLIANSNPANGAVNLSEDGSEFSIIFDNPLRIPKSDSVHLSCPQAFVWWTIANVIEGVNNKLYINNLETGQNYIVQIPEGLYDLNGLNQAIDRSLTQLGVQTEPVPLITLLPDSATQRVVIEGNGSNLQVDFTYPDTLREILGFDGQIYNIATPVLAPNVARFNTVNSFLLHTDLCNNGIKLNGKYNQTVAQVLINVAPGSQIVYEPFRPSRIFTPELSNRNITTARFWLTNDKNERVNTGGEYWSMKIRIEY